MSADRDGAKRQAMDEYRRRVRERLADADAKFRVAYAKELAELRGLSADELHAIAPGTAGTDAYDNLITVVQEASRLNMGQAELSGRIHALGDIALRIARKVPALAVILRS